MARQPMSMIGHMYSAGHTVIRGVFMNPVSRFIGRTGMQMAERLIPHGASEVGNALWTGNAYAPPVLHSPEQGNVHGTGKGQQQAAQVDSPQQQQASGWGHQAPMGYKEIGHSANHKIIDMKPQIESHSQEAHQRLLDSAALRGANSPKERGRER